MIVPQFDPVAFHLGPLDVHWYGIMYLIGFAFFWLAGRSRAKKDPWRGMTPENVEDLLFYGILGVVLGGRLGYCLFYQPGFYFSHPAEILMVMHGGMSAHGGILGGAAAILWYCRKSGKDFFTVSDFAVPFIPMGLFFGRIGNFINGELWGRVCSPDFIFAMVFPNAGDNLPRHPSQLYECALEGALLFAVLWIFSRKKRAPGMVSALFAIGYGCVRFFVEFFREPDYFLGIRALGLTQGQWLSLPLIAAGIAVIFWAKAKRS